MVKYLVEQCPVDLEHQDIMGRSPLYATSTRTHLKIVEYLISKGADVNAARKKSKSVLHRAAWNGEVEMVRLLLKQPNIRVNVQDHRGRTPLHMAVQVKLGEKHCKNRQQQEECALITKLLLDHGADPNIREVNGAGALDHACGTGNYSCNVMLIEAGADVNNADPKDRTPLHKCFYRGNRSALRALLASGKVDTGAKTIYGKIPIHSVFIDDLHECLSTLLTDERILSLNLNDPNVTASNFESLVTEAIVHGAENCLQVILDFQKNQSL